MQTAILTDAREIRRYRRSGYATAACIALACFACVSSAVAAPRAVRLSDARTAPTHLALLAPHARTTLDDWQCGRAPVNGSASDRYYSDTSAYGWDGHALGAQRWTRDHTVTYWRTRTGRVTFDGVVFRNHSRRAVLVAGWCE